MAAGDLTTLANVELALKLASGNPDEAYLTSLITRASATIQKRLQRTIASAAYVEKRNGTGHARLLMSQFPISAVSAVSVDGVTVAAQTSVPLGAGFMFDDISVYLIGSCWNRGFQNCSISYTAGFSSTPTDVDEGCVITVAAAYSERTKDAAIKSESVPGVMSVTYSDGADLYIPKKAWDLLKPYQRVWQIP